MGKHQSTDWIQGACIVLAVVVITFVKALNDFQKEQQFRALNAVKDNERVQIVRNGESAEVLKWDLLVGDVVCVHVGDVVPVDGIVFHEKELKTDESAMTGESTLMTKNCEWPLLLSGTKVMEGVGKMLVICVGEHMQAGIINTLMSGRPQARSKPNKPATSDSETHSAVYIQIESPRQHQRRSAPPIASGETETDQKTPLEGKLQQLMLFFGKFGAAISLLLFMVLCVRFTIATFVTDHQLEEQVRFGLSRQLLHRYHCADRNHS